MRDAHRDAISFGGGASAPCPWVRRKNWGGAPALPEFCRLPPAASPQTCAEALTVTTVFAANLPPRFDESWYVVVWRNFEFSSIVASRKSFRASGCIAVRASEPAGMATPCVLDKNSVKSYNNRQKTRFTKCINNIVAMHLWLQQNSVSHGWVLISCLSKKSNHVFELIRSNIQQ